MSFEMPVGMAYDGSQSVDSVTFVHADNSAAVPHFTIVDRKAPVKKGNSTTFAVYRFRTFRGAPDAVTGLVPKSVVETTIRWPASAEIADVNEDVEFQANLIGDANAQAAIAAFLLPRDVASA